jgi:hypothetical protein
MSNSYNDEYNITAKEGDNQISLYGSLNSENDEFDGYINLHVKSFFFYENLNNDEEDSLNNNCDNGCIDCNDDNLNDNTPFDNIETNHNLCQKKTSDISREKEKEKENIKNDEKPHIEISKANNNENGNSDTKKEKYIINTNDKKNNKKKTKKIGGPKLRKKRLRGKIKFRSSMEIENPFQFESILKYVNSFIKESKLLNIEKKVVKKIKLEFYKDLLKIKFKDILLRNSHNKEIIEKIYEEKNQKVIDILNMQLKDCINKFKENPTLKEYYDSFINDMKQKQKQPDDYIRNFEYYFDNFTDKDKE